MLIKKKMDNSKSKIKIIITDIDGTLLDDNSKLSATNRATLNLLKKDGFIIVLATGRSLFSSKKIALENKFLDLVDFIIFSTGAAILDVKKKCIFNTYSLNREDILEIENYLNETINADYMIQGNIPDNHFFSYKKNNRFKINSDFYRRIEIYKDSILTRSEITDSATQFIAIIPEKKDEIFNQVKLQLQERYSIIKTTSPLNKKTLWIEIFPKNVSKSTASTFLLKKLGLSKDSLITIGNDFNDMDLLKIGNMNFLLKNAPTELQEIIITNEFEYTNCKIGSTNIENGFTQVILKSI